MRAVVLATDPADGNAQLWRRQLQSLGVETVLLTGDPRRLPGADLVVAHLLFDGYGGRQPALDAARRYEQAGVPLLNSTATLARCADKWATHVAWHDAGLAQPRTWRLAEVIDWPQGRVLVKPAFGESARGIALVGDRAAAAKAAASWLDQALLQEVVPCRSVLRVHATAERVLGASARPAAPLAGLPRPDSRERPVTITDELRLLATRGVRALGGGLIGLDVIKHEGGMLLLEANPTFAIPTHLPRLLRALTLEAVLRARP